MNYQLAAAVLKGKWLLQHEAAEAFAPFVAGILNGYETETPEAIQDPEEDKLPEFLSFGPDSTTYFTARKYTSFDSVPYGSVAIIDIAGPLMKNDQYCGPRGMATTAEIIKKANASKNVAAIVLKVDSPGGTVDGTKDLADVVKQVKKPIISFIDGLAASAALWIASASNEIYASQEHTEIGSIGVVLSFADMQPAFEKLGVKFHTITAPQSKDKTKLFEDLRAGKYDEYKEEVLAPLADLFINTIKENRPKTKEERFTGKVYFAKDVEGELIDGIKTFEETVVRAKDLANEQNSTNQNQNIEMKKFENITAVLGAIEMQDGTVSLNEEQLEALNNALSAEDKVEIGKIATAAGMEPKEATAETVVSTVEHLANEQKEAAEKAEEKENEHKQAIKEKDDEIKKLQEENKALKGEAGAGSATVTSSKEKGEEGKDKKEAGQVVSEKASFMENVNAVKDTFL